MKRLVVLIMVICLNPISAQIGFNTLNPQITLAIDQDNLGINRVGENHLTLVTNGQPRISIPNNGFVGINQINPEYPLDINFAGSDLSIRNLNTISTSNIRYLVIDDDGLVKKRFSLFAFGEVMRVGAIDKWYNAGTNAEYNLEFFYDEINNAPNDVQNYFNDIPDSIINTTNHTITLSEGTYSINLKLIGAYRISNDDNRTHVKMLVNGFEHSFVRAMIYGSGEDSSLIDGSLSFNGTNTTGRVRKMGNFSELLIVPTGEVYTIQFKILPRLNHFRVFQFFVPTGSTGNSARTLLTISRIRQ